MRPHPWFLRERFLFVLAVLAVACCFSRCNQARGAEPQTNTPGHGEVGMGRAR